MADDTNYPHEDFLTDNKINKADLPEKLQGVIAKFKSEKDEAIKDKLDVAIYAELEDFIEARDKAAKLEKAKKKVDDIKAKKKLDVSTAATAAGNEDDEKKKKAAAAGEDKTRSVLRIIGGF